ncbi:hypothetical protein VTK73DRAFT_6576 [Phialemonium thermophilum]|uniref:Uncharacterized protein n=1 Tax=Phialemonium thermophilum TaxID=223376 RepID=A0ABR3WJV8_9PEZI
MEFERNFGRGPRDGAGQLHGPTVRGVEGGDVQPGGLQQGAILDHPFRLPRDEQDPGTQAAIPTARIPAGHQVAAGRPLQHEQRRPNRPWWKNTRTALLIWLLAVIILFVVKLQTGKRKGAPGFSWTGWAAKAATIFNTGLRLTVVHFGCQRMCRVCTQEAVTLLSAFGPVCRFRNSGLLDRVLSVLALLLLPLQLWLIGSIILGDGCNEGWNVYSHWPVRSRRDIRALIDVLWSVSKAHFEFAFPSARFSEAAVDVADYLVLALATEFWAVYTVVAGPCRMAVLLRPLVLFVLSSLAGAFAIRNWRDLMGGPRQLEKVGDAGVFCAILYILWDIPPEAICRNPKCW